MDGFREVTTTDGRTVEVLVGGDPDGFPWLFHCGSPSAAAPYEFLDDLARRLGLRSITFSRPGYGGSTPRPAPGRVVDDVAESVTVLDALDAEEFLTLGWSGGGPRALACAAVLPDRCRAAASMAGVAPYDAEGLDWYAGMGEGNVAEYHTAAAGPEPYRAFVEEELTPLFSAGPDDVVEALGGLAPPVDRAALTGEFAEWLSRTFNRAGVQGWIGARDDGLAAVSPWGFDVADIRVPVAIWQGRQDAMVPFGHGEWLARHVPGAEAHLLDDDGHLSLVARFEEILADLKRLGGVS